MITGTVTAENEAIVQIVLYGEDGRQYTRDAVVDSGYTGWLCLPPDVIEALGCPWREWGSAILGDGSQAIFDVYDATVLWDGQPK